MAATTIKYRGLSGLRVSLNVDTTDTLTSITNAAIADEGLDADFYADFFLLRDGTVKRSIDGGSSYTALALTPTDELVAVLDDDPDTFTKEQRQTRKLDIAAIKRAADTPARRSTYDLAQLPNPYNEDVAGVDDGASALTVGRPWTSDSINLNSLVTWLDPTVAVSGSSVIDQSAGSNNATLVSATHDATNDYFLFNGTNAYIRSANLYSDIGNPDTFSAGAWVYPTAAGVVLQIAGTPTPGQTYFFSALEFVESAGNPVPHFGLWNGTGTTSDTGTALSYNTWYHMVITYNGTTLKGYINGAEVASATVTFDSPHDDGLTVHHLLWGAGSATNMGDGTYYDGRMGEIRIYSDALTAPEVLSNYNARKSRYGY